jgi:hypothetical protein
MPLLVRIPLLVHIPLLVRIPLLARIPLLVRSLSKNLNIKRIKSLQQQPKQPAAVSADTLQYHLSGNIMQLFPAANRSLQFQYNKCPHHNQIFIFV